MGDERFFSNPKDLINITYNADAFKVIEKTIDPLVTPLVMPLDMLRDIDAIDSRHFYEGELDRQVLNLNMTSTSPKRIITY